MAEKIKKKEYSWEEIGKAIGHKIEKRKLEKSIQEECTPKKPHKYFKCNSMSAIYGLGFLGAAVYYIPNAVGFLGIVAGLLKAIVWPAFVVFELLKFLGS